MIEKKFDEIKLFKMHEQNEDWFNLHYKELKEKYENKFIAIKDKKIIFIEDEIEKLLENLEKEGINIDEVFITSIPPKGMASIL